MLEPVKLDARECQCATNPLVSDGSFRVLFENAPYGIALASEDCRFFDVNAAFCQIMGRDRAEVIGTTFYDYTHPDDVGRTELARDNVLGGRYPLNYLKRVVRKDGVERLCKVTNSAVFKADGSIDYVFAMVEDVTHLNNLENRNSQLAAIVESSSDAIFSLSLNGAIQTWNRGAELVYGYTAAEAVHRQGDLLIDAKSVVADSYLDAIKDSLAGKSSSNVDSFHRRKDGRHIPVSLSVSPIRNQFAQVEGVSIIARDTTVYRQTLVALDGSQQRMRKASERIARTNRELEQFAFVASHDLQEPLRTIASFLQLLSSHYGTLLDRRAMEYIEFSVEAAQRMQSLIRDLVHFSRTTRAYSTRRLLRVEDMVAIAISNLRATIEENRAEITVGALPAVRSHDTQIAQVFQNLIANAIKFRSDKPPKVHVDAERVGDEWVFSVRDNGIGFSNSHRDRIFVIFQRLHTWDEYPGTGVGLAICKKIIDSHGGRIWADAEIGNGAVFSFSIPADRDEGASEAI